MCTEGCLAYFSVPTFCLALCLSYPCALASAYTHAVALCPSTQVESARRLWKLGVEGESEGGGRPQGNDSG